MAYIIPAYKVFNDIENRFGVPPCLPSETAPDPIRDRIIQSSEPIQNYTTSSRSFASAFNFDNRVCAVRLPWTGAKSPQMYSPRLELIRARPRVEFLSSRVEELRRLRSLLEVLPMKALGDSSNRKASIETSWGPSFGQRTWRHRNGTSGSQFMAFHKREDYSKQVQGLQSSDSRAPSVTERRRTPIPARAVSTGVEPLRESLLLAGPDYDDTDYTALSYEWGESMIGTLSKDTENLDFGLHRSQGTPIWVDEICNHQRDWREVHAQVSHMGDIDANATRMKILLGERADYSHATMSIAHSIQAMILGYVEELESPKSPMRCNLFAPEIVLYCALTQLLEARKLVKELNMLAGEHTKRKASTRPLPETAHPIQRVPLRVSSLPSSDSVSLVKSIRGFEKDFLDFLRTPCARLKLKSRTNAACLELSDVESTRFRATITQAARLASLSSYLRGFLEAPTGHLNEDANALTYQFVYILRRRWLSKGRAACGDPAATFQQHGATLGKNYYRRLPIASVEEPNLHVLSDHLAEVMYRLGDFLGPSRDAMISSDSLQFLLSCLVTTSRHLERHMPSLHNAVAHFEGTLQSLMDRMQRLDPQSNDPRTYYDTIALATQLFISNIRRCS